MKVTINPQKVTVSVDPKTLEISVGNPMVRDYVERTPYTGDYEITPSSETQVLLTKHLRMTDNVVINPIPSNYGRIDWDGTCLIVS